MTDSVDDEYEGHSAMELWLHDLSVDSATRVAGGLMIFIGSLLGLLLSSQVAVEGGELFVSNCTFANSSSGVGGAVLLSGGALTVEDTTFVGCRARRGNSRRHALASITGVRLVRSAHAAAQRPPVACVQLGWRPRRKARARLLAED